MGRSRVAYDSAWRFNGAMPEPTPSTRQQKITLGEMRSSGVRGLLIYCSDYKCSHWATISGDRWPDDVRLSNPVPLFVCQANGQRGADIGRTLTGNYRDGAPVADRRLETNI